MNKPYIVCHMMTSVDGRIDCAMTEHLPGVQEYYDTLDALDAPTRISGRVTAELEMALPGKFEAKTAEALGKEAFSKAADVEGYEIVVDTHGTLLWGESAEDERPLLILTSEQVSKEYLASAHPELQAEHRPPGQWRIRHCVSQRQAHLVDRLRQGTRRLEARVRNSRRGV